jgi:hypothetical protein
MKESTSTGGWLKWWSNWKLVCYFPLYAYENINTHIFCGIFFFYFWKWIILYFSTTLYHLLGTKFCT